MKRYFFLLFLLLTCTQVVLAQGVVTTRPTVFTAKDRVVITVDVTGTPVEGISPLYIWAFIPGGGGDAITNGPNFNSSLPAARMTQDPTNPNKWSFTVSSSVDFFAKPAGAVTAFGFLVKNQDGTKQTADFTLPVKPLEYIAKRVETFPSNFSEADVVTIKYNQSKETVDALKYVDASATPQVLYTGNLFIYLEARAKNAAGVETVYRTATSVNTVDVSVDTYKMRNTSPGIYTFRLIPRRLFTGVGLQANETITDITVNIRKENAAQARRGQTGPVVLTPFTAN
ncbi:hypothetical protein IC235_02180 [Hymenobacter sp. BT664]|uniref:Uncharacterized protein n=1 Tax=Hymenobacter montanus TaxID=2771359 RepID=A0A927BA60_9BACT|nr:hypothetical protein [Hymenobacter montanus]MBD2766696.1 hypothetical protein [Hymenobacter montanus]